MENFPFEKQNLKKKNDNKRSTASSEKNVFLASGFETIFLQKFLLEIINNFSGLANPIFTSNLWLRKYMWDILTKFERNC